MALTALRPYPKFRWADSQGNPLAGGKLYTYAAGTSGPLATYTTSAGTTANTNPVILDANGEADVWFQPLNYKLVLKDADDNLIWSVDNYSGSPYPLTDEWLTYVHTWTFISATQVTVPGDQTAIYAVNKAIRAVCTGGTFYGTITVVGFAGGVTTLTVDFEAGYFDSGVAGSSKISVGVMASDSPALQYANSAAASAGRAEEVLLEIEQQAMEVATAAGGATKWVANTVYTEGVCVWSPLDYQTYRRKVTGAGATDPFYDAVNWEKVVRPTEVQAAPTVTAPAQFQTAGNLEISFSGDSKLVGGSIASFVVVWPDGSNQTVAATGNAGSATKAIVGTIGETKSVSVRAVDALGNRSAATTKTFTIVANNPPTGTMVVSAPTQVNKNSTGNQISFSGITDADGDGVTYTITDPGILTFSKLKGITAGEIVTFSAGEVAVDTNTTISVKAVDPKGGETAVVQRTILVKAVIIIGVVLKSPGTVGGGMSHIDKDGNDIADPGASWFNSHPIYGGIVEQTIDGQAMVKIPKFYYKRAIISGGANAGKMAWWISDQPLVAEGFKTFPAFNKNGGEIAQFWVGKYQATIDGTNKLQSANVNSYPSVSLSIGAFRARANDRNVNGVTGFMVWSSHQWHAIQWLYLIENKTFDSQTKTGTGNISGTVYHVNGLESPASISSTYRGITGLWGNVWQLIEGLLTNGGNIIGWGETGRNDTDSIYGKGTGSTYPVTFIDSTDRQRFGFHPVTGSNSLSSCTTPDIYNILYSDGATFYQGAVGGNVSGNQTCGLWAIKYELTTSSGSSDTGSRLAKE